MIRFFQDKSHKEVARTLGVSEEAAKKRVARALEKLRLIFAKKGSVAPAASLLATLSAHGAQAAPPGLTASVGAMALAKGAIGSTTSLATAKGILKLMAWAKAKTAMALGAGVLLAAAGVVTSVVTADNSSMEDTIGKLQRHTGKTIVWDHRLNLPANFSVKDLPLEEALDELAVEAGGYWSVDYVVYDTDRALRQFLSALHDAIELEPAGWTNLSSRPLKPQMQIIGYRQGGGMRMGTNASDDLVGMIVMLDREASAKQGQRFRQWFMQNRQAFQNGQDAAQPPNQELRIAIEKAMNEGMADGVLAPERLLAESQVVSKISLSVPVPATSEAAAQTAKAARAKWTTIYTLHKSPVEGAGIKLIHAGRRTMNGVSDTNQISPGSGAIMKQMEERRFNLTPEERAAHERAVEAAKAKP